jgi:hypothetical protein
MERTLNVYEVKFESVHGGDRTAYIEAKTEAEVEKRLSNKDVAYIAKSGSTRGATLKKYNIIQLLHFY